MKTTLWILLVIALCATVYFTNFSDLSGTTAIISRAVSGVVAAAAGVCLWLIRGEKDSSKRPAQAFPLSSVARRAPVTV